MRLSRSIIINLLHIIYILFTSIVIFCIHLWPRIGNKIFGVDTFRHLLIADYVRKNKMLPSKSHDKYLLKGDFDYPPVIFFLVSLFPKKYELIVQQYFSGIVEFINNFICGIFIYNISNNIFVTVICQFIISTTPVIVMETCQLSTRGLGYLLFNLTLFSIYFYFTTQSILFLLPAVLFMTIIHFTHKMASQVVLLFIPVLALTLLDIFVFLSVIISYILALIVGRKYYIKIVIGHISVIKFFSDNIMFRYAHQVKREGLEKIKNDLISRIKSIMSRQPLIAVISSNSVIVGLILLMGYYFFKSNISYQKLPFDIKFMFLWFLILFFWSVSTAQIAFMKFLGEGTKYVVYLNFPVVFLMVSLGFQLDFPEIYRYGYISLFALASLFQTLFLQYKIILKDEGRSLTPDIREIFKYINEQKADINLGVFPLYLSEITAYFTKARVLSTDSAAAHKNNEDYRSYNPVLKKDFSYFIEKYKINYALLLNKYLDIKDLNINNIHTEVAVNNKNYSLIKIK